MKKKIFHNFFLPKSLSLIEIYHKLITQHKKTKEVNIVRIKSLLYFRAQYFRCETINNKYENSHNPREDLKSDRFSKRPKISIIFCGLVLDDPEYHGSE